MTATETLVHAVRILILTLKLDPALSMSRSSLGVWVELEQALVKYEQERETP